MAASLARLISMLITIWVTFAKARCMHASLGNLPVPRHNNGPNVAIPTYTLLLLLRFLWISSVDGCNCKT